MWHASISGRVFPGWAPWEQIARRELRGVGDATRGEWVERGETALHLRRRLSAREERPDVLVCDIRHTDEHEQRVRRIQPQLPATLARLTVAELLEVG